MNIYQSIAAIMTEGYAIRKDKKNPQQGFSYRGIDDVMNVFQPLMAKHGVFVVPEVLEASREDRQTAKGTSLIYSVLTIRYTFYAADGTSVSAVVIGEGMDSGDKASNKALSAGMKYALFQTFCVPTEELVDPDSETPPETRKKAPAPKPEPEKPKAEAEKPYACCERCGKRLMPYKDHNGKTVSLRAHIEGSQKKFGQILCLDCIKEGQNNA